MCVLNIVSSAGKIKMYRLFCYLVYLLPNVASIDLLSLCPHVFEAFGCTNIALCVFVNVYS